MTTLALTLASGCGDDTPSRADAADTSASDTTTGDTTTGDTGGDDTAEPPDTHTDPDGEAPDADAADADTAADGEAPVACTPVTLGALLAESSDVSVALVAPVQGEADDEQLTFRLLFERYSPEPDVGTFDLSLAPDDNFGTCAHCVVAAGDGTGATTYFADRGTLVMRADPYSRRFDLRLTDARLIEVTVDPFTRQSTPVPNGRCLTLPELDIDQVFPPDDWTCAADTYHDGQGCHCDCTAFDPDCDALEGAEPKPNVDCAAGEVCGFDPVAVASECVTTCDWRAREACDTGVCVYSIGVAPADTCISQVQLLDQAALGGTCQYNGFQRFCAIADGFAMGYCDEADVCRPICASDAECTIEGESCRFFVLDGQSLGFCGPPPPRDG